jgi:hypothetical protein
VRTAPRVLLSSILITASCAPSSELPAVLTVEASDLPGDWIGTLHDGEGSERAVLRIDGVTAAAGYDRFTYRLDMTELVEEGVGRVWQEDGQTLRLCFSDRACGTVLRREGRLHIESDPRQEDRLGWNFRSSP